MSTSFAAALFLFTTAAAAAADEPVALVFQSMSAKDESALRAQIDEKLKDANVRMLDRAATMTAVSTFHKGSLAGTSDESLAKLRSKMGVSHLVLVRQLAPEKRDKAEKVAVFHFRIFGPGDSPPTIVMKSIPDAPPGLVEGLAAAIADVLPRQRITPSDEAAPPDEEATGTSTIRS